MGDPQRSQTISTGNQEFAQAVACSTAISEHGSVPPVLTGESSLVRIRQLAESDRSRVFNSLAHRIDYDLLRQAFRSVRKSKVPGVDKMTVYTYTRNLDQNLYNLYERLRRGQYVAQPVKRIWIAKEDGKKRPIGILVLEDKIVQKAVEMILNVIYDIEFHDFSYGFRKGRSQHQAVRELREGCLSQNVNWIVSADITGLFDNIDHALLKDAIRRRVNDGGIIRLIGKWLNAGVMEGEDMSYPEEGTPQGGVISPILSNIFLHYVLDEWFVKEVRPRMSGRCFIIRWADDFILGFEFRSDAQQVMEVLSKRFAKFELALHPEKTKLIRFSRFSNAKKNGTFDFLGFTFYWSRSLKGYPVIKKKTARKRQSRFMRGIWQWCKRNRHKAMSDQYETLCSKLRGFYQYFGVRCNYESLKMVRWYTGEAWHKWLNRRSHKGSLSKKNLRAWYPLPEPRIVHNV